MAKKRSSYDFTLRCNPSLASQIISQWLGTNNFTQTTKKGEEFFISNDIMQGARAFKCQISGNQLHIDAWIPSLGSEYALDDGFVAALPKSTYKRLLNELFAALQQADTAAVSLAQAPAAQAPAAQAPAAQAPVAPVAAPPAEAFVQNFRASANKQNEIMTEIAFWFSILALLLSFGSMFTLFLSGSVSFVGVVIYVLGYIMAVKGLHTRKRGKAIAAIVMYSVSVFFLLCTIAFVMIFG